MARAPDPRIEEAKAMYLKGRKLIEIAKDLDLPEGTVRRWKSTHRWESERSDRNSERSVKRKQGAQPGNKNSSGGPLRNKKAEKYGFFSKYLPEETVSIIQEMPTDPLEILWHQIQIAYTAIIRAQRIMYVKDKEDKTIEKIGHKDGETITEERWEVQQAWDKHGNFMRAQAKAQAELRGAVKQYEKLLHENWELATEEQKSRIALLNAKIENERLQKESDNGSKVVDDWIAGIMGEDTEEDGADERQ